MALFYISTIVITVLTFSGRVLAECNRCSQYNTMCVSSTQYQFCNWLTGTPLGESYPCAENQICSTAASPSTPCVDKVDNLLPDCLCGYCANGFYACVSDNQFQICIDPSSPSGPTFQCPSGKSCDSYVMNGTYCSVGGISNCPAEVIVTTPSISTSRPTTSTTTTGTTPKPDTTCTTAGKFPTPNTRCKGYYVCILANNQWIKTDYSCTGNALYDPRTQRCSLLYVCPA